MRISRRGVLKVAGAALGGSALLGLGLNELAQQMLPQGTAAEPVTPDDSFGPRGSGAKRVLVGYATRTGSTVGVAEAIGKTLGERGFAVDVKPMKHSPLTEGYQAMVLGSAINGARWLPEAVAFVEANRAAMARVAVALFCVHGMNLGDDEGARKNRLAYLDAIRPLVKPSGEAFFAGLGLDPANQTFGGWVYRTLGLGPEGDLRDWVQIGGWAATVPL